MYEKKESFHIFNKKEAILPSCWAAITHWKYCVKSIFFKHPKN
jgi:hypothetical protein